MAVVIGESYSQFGNLLLLGFHLSAGPGYIERIEIPWMQDLYEFNLDYCRHSL